MKITTDEAKKLAKFWRDCYGKNGREQGLNDQSWADEYWKCFPTELLVCAALTDPFVYKSLGNYILYLQGENKVLPLDVAEFVADVFLHNRKAPRLKKSQKDPKTLWNDRIIAMSVHMLDVIGDIDPVGHSLDARADTGCGIVAGVWELDFHTIRKAYGKFKKERTEWDKYFDSPEIHKLLIQYIKT